MHWFVNKIYFYYYYANFDTVVAQAQHIPKSRLFNFGNDCINYHLSHSIINYLKGVSFNFKFISGQKFAMYEMKSTITNVIRHYELYSAGPEYELKLALAIILKATNGVNIKLKLRSYK